jgi:hypothetical protein
VKKVVLLGFILVVAALGLVYLVALAMQPMW